MRAYGVVGMRPNHRQQEITQYHQADFTKTHLQHIFLKLCIAPTDLPKEVLGWFISKPLNFSVPLFGFINAHPSL